MRLLQPGTSQRVSVRLFEDKQETLANRGARPTSLMALDLLIGVSSEGATVAEAELGDGNPNHLIEQARERGAELLWLHTSADLSSFGFSGASGYVRMHAEVAPKGEQLPELAKVDYATTLDGAYRALWGHKQVAANATPPEDAVVVGLYDGDDAIGLCTVFTSERLVDGPGVVPQARNPSHYARLLLGACAVLGPGSVDLDSWGDRMDVLCAYADLGFAPVERVGGWELRLPESE